MKKAPMRIVDAVKAAVSHDSDDWTKYLPVAQSLSHAINRIFADTEKTDYVIMRMAPSRKIMNGAAMRRNVEQLGGLGE